jgi:hypothetical protein
MTERRTPQELDEWLKNHYEHTCALPRRRIQPSMEMPFSLGSEPEPDTTISVNRLIELEDLVAGRPGIMPPQTDYEKELVGGILQEVTKPE